MIFTKELKKQVFGASPSTHFLRNTTVVQRPSIVETDQSITSMNRNTAIEEFVGRSEPTAEDAITER